MSVRNPKSIGRLCRDLLPLLHRAARGRRMLDSVEAVVATDRWNAFDRFHDTTRTIAAAYEAGGAKVEVEPIPTGGRIGTGRWVIHEAADFRSASLEVVSPVRRHLVDYGNNPFHGVMWGVATPPGGTRCELVVLDDPGQFDRLPAGGLAGKAVLTRLIPRDHLGQLGALSAPCVISDKPVLEHPNALSWTRFGWGGIPIETGPVRLTGFAISRRQGEVLRDLHAKRGPLTLRIKADIRRYAGTHDVVSGVIPGRDDPQDEVWALAHTCEPGAMDNASGVATCIEIARVMEGLIAAGRLPRPRRSIRLLHGFECYGFFAYMEHVKRFQKPLAGVVIDTVGARPRVCGGRLGWHATIPMSAGFVNRIGEAALRAALRIHNPGYRFCSGPFISTSDTLVGDPKYGFPCPWLTTYLRGPNRPYDAYHSSADTIGLLSAAGLRLGASAMAAYLYYLADAGTEEVMELATAETDRVERKARETSGNRARYLREQHQVSIDHLKRWLWGGDRREIQSHLGACEKRIGRACGRATAPRSTRGRAGHVPRRTGFLSPTLENTPGPIADRIRRSKIAPWGLFWADGRRSLADIARAVSCEHGKRVTVEQVEIFFEAHAELGYVELIRPDRMLERPRLVRDLRALGVRRGIDVMVHSSLSRIGMVRGGADTVVEALLSVVGPGGTLMAPSFNHGRADVFNPLTTPTINGAVADALWRRPGAVRSLHASHSVAAVGRRAQTYCRGHLEVGVWSQDSPIGRLIHNGGYILSLGVTNAASTAYHVAEIAVPCRCIDPFGFRDRVVRPDGSVAAVRGLAWRSRECPVSPTRLDRTLDRRGLQRHGTVGAAPSTLVMAIELWRTRIVHLRNVCPTCTIRPLVQG